MKPEVCCSPGTAMPKKTRYSKLKNHDPIIFRR